MLKGLEIEELRDLTLSVGTHQGKRRLTPVEVAYLFQKAIRSGATLRECANFVHLEGTSMVSRFLKLTKTNPSIQYLIDWGHSSLTISFTAATELAGLAYDEQVDVCKTIIANQLNKSEVQQVFQLYHRTGRRVSDCIEEIIRMRPTIDRQYVFLGSITDRTLRDSLENQRQSERDKMLMEALQTDFGSLHVKSARLGHELFTIVTDREGFLILKEDGKESFEQDINKTLMKRFLHK